MFQVLFSVGGLHFQTIWLFTAASAIAFGYIIFLLSEDRLLPTEKVFDLLGFAALAGVVVGKITDLVLSLGQGFSGINFWGAILPALLTIFYFAKRFKLSRIQVIDNLSLAAIPALAIFWLGKLIVAGITTVNLFSAVWLILATLVFWQTAKKIQLAGFYFLAAGGILAVFDIVKTILVVDLLTVKIFDLAISSLILTIVIVILYKKNNRKFFEIVKMVGGKTLEKIKRLLSRQRKTLETELATLKKDDPLITDTRTESRESGDDAYKAEGHERITVVREELKKGLSQVKKALAAIGVGKYGKCERCGKPIEPRRLKVLPQATLCFSCEREVEKQST